jgi:hypothetical protein
MVDIFLILDFCSTVSITGFNAEGTRQYRLAFLRVMCRVPTISSAGCRPGNSNSYFQFVISLLGLDIISLDRTVVLQCF